MALLNTLAQPQRLRFRAYRWAAGLVLAALLNGGALTGSAQTPRSPAQQVKAVFLFNFAQFVEWPAHAFPTTEAPLVIGVLGENPFGNYLDEAVRGEKAGNHPLVIQQYRRTDEIQACHVLFIASSEAGHKEQIFAGLRDRNILTVSDGEDFARHGGMIQFFTEKGRLRLKINLDAIKAEKLTINSNLLRPAEIVNQGKD